MASNFIANGDDLKEEEHNFHHHHYSHHHQGPSPRGVRRALSTNSSSSSFSSACGAGTAIPKCVCAPATHAGSFKCRLHRANPHGHAPPSPTSIPPPRPPVNASTTPTVEAQ